MDIFKWTFGDIRIERCRLVLCTRNIAVHGRIEPHFAKLAQDDRAKLANVQWRGT